MRNKLKGLTSKWFFLPLAVGVIARIFFSLTTLHADLLGHSFTAYFFSEKGIVNIYDHLASLPSSHPLVTNFGVADIFIYPPLTYFTLGIFRVLSSPFVSSEFIPWLWSNLGQVYQYPGLTSVLFWFKIFYLPFDIGLGFLLVSLFKKAKQKKQVFWLWMLNPVTIYSTFMIGQLDLLPTFFLVLAIKMFSDKKLSRGMVGIGIAASYKMFPIFLIFPIAFLLGRKLKDKFKYCFYGILPFLITIAPFLGSSAFRGMVLFSPKSQKMLYMGWPVSGAEVIYPFLVGFFLLCYLAWYHPLVKSASKYMLLVLLLILSLTHFHPQWFLWATPFLIIELVRSNFRLWLPVAAIFIAWLGITLLFDFSLSVGLFAPLNNDLVNAKGLADVLPAALDEYKAKSILRSLLASSSIFLFYNFFKEKDLRESNE